MKPVNNSGSGNCLYHAYAIGLIYHLKSLSNAHPSIDQICNKVQLPELDRRQLQTILERKSTLGLLSTQEIRWIEANLSPKLRKIAADHTYQEFVNAPLDSQIYASLSYKIKLLTAYKLKSLKRPDLVNKIAIKSDPHTKKNYLEADIFRLPGIHKAIDRYTTLLATKYDSFTQPSLDIESNLEKDSLHFLSANNNKNMQLYRNYLATNGTWGTDEALFVLHQFITSDFKQNKIAPIHLQVLQDGSNKSYGLATPDLILDNHNNEHWVSQVPARTQLRLIHLSKNDTNSNTLLKIINELDNSIPFLRQSRTSHKLANNIDELSEMLLQNLVDVLQRKNLSQVGNIQNKLSYRALHCLSDLISSLQDPKATQADHMKKLAEFEKISYRHSSFYRKYGRWISAIVVAITGIVLGALAGFAAAHIAGLAVGATVGFALSAYTTSHFFNHKNRLEKLMDNSVLNFEAQIKNSPSF